jgi:hypothetical protein
VYRTRGSCSNYKILWIINLIAAPMSKPWASAYSLEASTLWVTCLHLIKDQWSTFADLFRSISTIIKPIYNNRSLLLVKEAFINISKLRELMSSGTKVSPLVTLLICH